MISFPLSDSKYDEDFSFKLLVKLYDKSYKSPNPEVSNVYQYLTKKKYIYN